MIVEYLRIGVGDRLLEKLHHKKATGNWMKLGYREGNFY